ncbi:Ocs element-binding factor 1 [Acorus gramineus]|uniref:Ocs element-binding factor 1 n=1 Tax=Acorus gramineus TaxID=55184 RepID=A0AAV9BWL7_ACOGR|nr:Ocs element-binding factor 1 [Acorus gramineus]
MTAKQVPTQSSGSEGDSRLTVDQRKEKRMLSNRESARRSRMRKQKHLDELLAQVTQLKMENAQIANRISFTSQHFMNLDSENTILRTQVMELTERLRSLNSVLKFVEDFSGVDMDIPEIPDALLEPWQLPCPSQPLMADAFPC